MMSSVIEIGCVWEDNFGNVCGADLCVQCIENDDKYGLITQYCVNCSPCIHDDPEMKKCFKCGHNLLMCMPDCFHICCNEERT